MMPHAEITWKGMVLELLSEKETCRIWGRRLGYRDNDRILQQNPGDCTMLTYLYAFAYTVPLLGMSSPLPKSTNILKSHFLQEVFPDLTRVGWLCDSLPWKFPTLTLVPAPP